jgi:hypothetical protein
LREVGVLLVQTSGSWIALEIVGITAVLIQPFVYDGGLSAIGLILGPAVEAVDANLAAVVLSLPLRLIVPIRSKLSRFVLVLIAVAIAGVVLVILSFVFGRPGIDHDETGLAIHGIWPQPVLYATGVMVIALGLTNLRLPFGRTKLT